MKLKNILREILIESGNITDNQKTINDEFRVNDYMLNNIQRILDKVNKNLKSRTLPELKIHILKSENITVKKDVEGGLDNMYTVLVHTIKIEGDVPEIKDFEFIAKIEHGEDGNIINQVPNTSVEKLPTEYKTFNQKCDICNTNRERLNTFILKKVSNTPDNKEFQLGQLITAGSSCLKRFLPLDSVKKFLDYAVQLETLRNVLAEYENALSDPDSEYFGGGDSRGVYTYNPEQIMIMCCIAYYNNGAVYLSNTKAREYSKQSTLQDALNIIQWSEGRDEELRRDAQEIIRRYKPQAEDMAKKVIDYAQTFDFDEAAIKNPSFDSYFSNLKVLLNRPYLEGKHLAYYSSLISLYLRSLGDIKKKETSAQIEFYGNIGDKVVDIPVTVTGTYSFESAYGTQYVYIMKDDTNHVFVYKGKLIMIPNRNVNYDPETEREPRKTVELEKGNRIALSGTIAKHNLYKDIKQTVIQRPKIKTL